MALSEETQHNVLLAITSILFILLATGTAIPDDVTSPETIVIPPA